MLSGDNYSPETFKSASLFYVACYRGIDIWKALFHKEPNQCHCLDVLSFISRAAYMYMYAGGKPQATLNLRPNINGVMDGYNDFNFNKLKAKLLDRNAFATLLTGVH